MNLPVLHGGTPDDGHVLLGLDWLELVTLVAVLGILVGAIWAWVVGARAQKAEKEGSDSEEGPRDA